MFLNSYGFIWIHSISVIEELFVCASIFNFTLLNSPKLYTVTTRIISTITRGIHSTRLFWKPHLIFSKNPLPCPKCVTLGTTPWTLFLITIPVSALLLWYFSSFVSKLWKRQKACFMDFLRNITLNGKFRTIDFFLSNEIFCCLLLRIVKKIVVNLETVARICYNGWVGVVRHNFGKKLPFYGLFQ